MITIALEVEVTNEGADAARSEIRSFLQHMDRKMAGDLPDRKGTAPAAYVVMRKVLSRIEAEFEARAQRDREAALRNAPTVREARGR